MIGAIDPNCKRVTVVGAGASGLFAAYYLDRGGYEVTLVEANDKVGGLISTSHTSFGLAERAANSMIQTPELQELCSALGVRISPLREDSRSKYIYRNGKLRKFPLSIGETFRLLSCFLKKNKTVSKDMESWARTYLGDDGFRYLIDPMITGIYGTDAKNISVSAAFPQLSIAPGKRGVSLLRKKKDSGSRGRGPIVSVNGGLEVLFHRLGEHLQSRLGDRFRLNTKCVNLKDYDENLVLCVPAHISAELLISENPELSNLLAQTQYTSMVSAGVFVAKEQLNSVPQGLGVLIPSGSGLKTLGVLFSSSSFEGRVSSSDHALLTVLLGGSRDPDMVHSSDGVLHEVICNDLGKLFGLRGDPLHIEINRWPQAIPVYSNHLEKVWSLASSTWCSRPGRVLFGNYTGQVSLRGMLGSASGIV